MLSSECSVGHFPLTDATDHLDKGCESREQVSVREVDENAKLEPVLLKRKKKISFPFFLCLSCIMMSLLRNLSYSYHLQFVSNLGCKDE